MRRKFLGVCTTIAFAWMTPAWAAPESPPPTSAPAAAATAAVVRYRADRLTVDLREAPLGEVLREIARQSGAGLVGEPREARRVTVAFDDVTLKEGLERIVGAQNFTLKYDDAGKLKTIELKGGPEAAKPPEPAKAAEARLTTPPKWYAFYKVFNNRDQVRLTGELRTLFKREEMGWDYLGNTALGHPDARVRRMAMHQIVRALEQDPELRAAVVDTLTAMNDVELAEFARAIGYHRAEDFVRNALREIQESELRTRARGVLRELRKNPFKGTPPEMH